MDEYMWIGESTVMERLKKFVTTIINVFSLEYLRSPNANNIALFLVLGEHHGFQGMQGSIDCMHCKWKNYPPTWKGMYSRHSHEFTIILEIFATYDFWI